MLKTLLIIVIVYISYLLIWGLICLIAFSLSLIFKKPAIIKVISGISQVVVYILSSLIGLGILIYTVSLLLHGEILWFFVMIFVGMGVVAGILSFLQMPFMLIPAYLEEKVENMEREEDVVRGEILDENNKVIGVVEGEKDISRRLAIYFILVYGLNLLSLLLNSTEYPGYKFGDYLLTPFLWTMTGVVFLGIIIGIFRKVSKGKFFYPRKKIFLTSVLKVNSICLIVLSVLYLLLGV